MRFSSLPFIPFIVSLFPAILCATALSDTASTMQPGTWREVFTNNVNPVLSVNTSSTMIPYTDDITYDPGSKRFYYIGSDHCKYAQFITYDETANAWQNMTRPSWMPSPSAYCNGMMHGYDHGSVDPVNGRYYHRDTGAKRVHRYNTSTQAWTMTPDLPFGDPTNCCDALEYFPELGGVVWVNGSGGFPGRVYLYKESTSQWSQLATGLTAGTTYQYAEYNPVHKVMVFTLGGSFYKLSSAGQVSPLKSPPFSLYNGSGYVGVLTVDPVSGLYLALTPVARNFYTYDVTTDTWQQQSAPSKPNMNNNGVVATPVGAYGVTFFTACTPGGCHVYLYKHSAGSGVEKGRSSAGVVISAHPNPFHRATTLRLGLKGNAAIYDLLGRVVAFFPESRRGKGLVRWEPRHLPAGLYFLKVSRGGKALVQRLYHQK